MNYQQECVGSAGCKLSQRIVEVIALGIRLVGLVSLHSNFGGLIIIDKQ